MEMNGDGAKRLGEKLLMEVEVEDLSEVWNIDTISMREVSNVDENTVVQVST